ncbi:MAG: hypothetical protein V4584_17610 [Verrucomicrobiota bacterium]
MNSSLSDPNNHVPEVTPDDGWDDAEGSTGQNAATQSALPPRRTVADRASEASKDARENGNNGLRIEPNVFRSETSDSTVRLEVQELGSSVVRLEQTAPAPPKIERLVKFHERPTKEKDEGPSKGENESWGTHRRHSPRWIIGAGVGVVAIVILVMLLLPFINAPNAARSNTESASVTIEENIEGMEALNLLLARQPEAMQIYRTFATATSADDVLPLMRDAKTLGKTLREHWRPLGVSKQWTPAEDSSWTVAEISGHPCGVLEGTLPDHTGFTACFTNDGNRLLLDWKATSAFGTATFAQLEQGGGDTSEIRGEISTSEFYSATWPEADYQSYRLIAPDGETAVWCYARRQDQTDRLIVPLFNQGEIVQEAQTSRRVTLRLERGPEGALPNQWLIGEVLHIDWIAP